jgi:hypothetical protein
MGFTVNINNKILNIYFTMEENFEVHKNLAPLFPSKGNYYNIT